MLRSSILVSCHSAVIYTNATMKKAVFLLKSRGSGIVDFSQQRLKVGTVTREFAESVRNALALRMPSDLGFLRVGWLNDCHGSDTVF
jgi:hypothetical protein